MNKASEGSVQGRAAGVDQRLGALVQLGRVMAAMGSNAERSGPSVGLTEAEYVELDRLVRNAHLPSGWATEENVRHAFAAWGAALIPENVRQWALAYPALDAPRAQQRVGLVLAGNVPLVGLHDVLCTWFSGHKAIVKCSSQEPDLLPALVQVLDRFMPDGVGEVAFTTGKLGEVDALIATGSNNTARYFEHYFAHVPRIVRRSRVSVAVLDGTETPEELAALGEDVFRYFGLGCRNVAKVYLPGDFELDRLFEAFYPWNPIVHHKKYGNNYDYTRALWLLDRVPFMENGFLLLREQEALPSAVATLHYERYMDRAALEAALRGHAGEIQCIVGHGHVPFGQAQQPELWDYADGVDTMEWLLRLP